MKRAKRLITGIIFITVICSGPAAFAVSNIPYHTYNYDYWQDVYYTPAAYIPDKSYSGDDLNVGPFKNPQDIFVAHDGKVYIADTENNRIIILDDTMKVDRIIETFDNNGTLDSFQTPSGLFVTNKNELYIADTGNFRIVALTQNGNLMKIIQNPTSEVLDADFIFAPLKIAVDYADRVYAVSKNMFQGIMAFDSNTNFTGFIGTIKVNITIYEKIWRRLSTKAQRKRQIQFIPTEFTNLDIDPDGFVYATNIDPKGEQSVRRLNPKGEDVIKKKKDGYLSGDIYWRIGSDYSGPSRIVDIVYRGSGIYSILDMNRGRIFTYDHESNLLYIFGGKGSQKGTFRNPAAIEVKDDKILVLDAHRGEIMSAVLGKENVIITHIDSQAVNWKYIIITAEKAYMGQLNILRNKMVLSVVLCCVIGSLIIFYLLRHNYTPLKSVVKSIEESAAELADGVMNEFQYITQTIKQLQNEKKVTNEIMKKQKRTLSSQMVLNLVENRDITNEIDLHTLEKYDICFQSDIFLVLTFFVFDGEGPFPNDNEIIDDKEKNKMICLIIQNITEELFREKDIKTFFFHTGRLIGFIINPPPGNESALIDDISDKHEQVTNSINRYFLIKFVSACSDMHRTLKAIPAAYSEALQVIEYNSMFGFNKVLFYHDLVELPREENFYYPEETENYIINNLKIGNAETVCDTIKKIIDLNIENNSAPVTIRYLVVNIAGTIIKVINQFEKKKYSIPQLSFQALLQENSLSEMYNKIEKNVHAVCEAIKRQNDGKKKPVCADLYEKAINIVKENYSNTNLNVAMIAQELDVHVVHLSRTFMKYHGESLSYYINSVRLAEAKKLIHTGQKLEAISEKVGFGSLRTFMRVFKKYEGITPGQYKEALEKVH
jgi:AraC-like DNA-binding protein/DNA-binding beta-propeller fold protein YncE